MARKGPLPSASSGKSEPPDYDPLVMPEPKPSSNQARPSFVGISGGCCEQVPLPAGSHIAPEAGPRSGTPRGAPASLISLLGLTTEVTEDTAVPERKPPRVWAVRTKVLGAIMVAVFLSGVSVGLFALSTWVTPNVTLTGPAAGIVVLSAPCNGWPQFSFDGYFQCTVTLTCTDTHGGPGYGIDSASAPGASNLIVTPDLPIGPSCNAPQDLHITGELGYSGPIEVYLHS